MPLIFAVNQNNDMYVENGVLVTVTDLEAVLQACAHIAKAQLGEMVLLINRGIPNFQTVWTDATRVPQFEAALRSAILSIQNVIDIISLDITIENNILSYRILIVTTFGNGIVNG